MAIVQRRRFVEPPKSHGHFDLNYEMSDLQNWLDHTIQPNCCRSLTEIHWRVETGAFKPIGYSNSAFARCLGLR